MSDRRGLRLLIVCSLLAAFGLGALFGALLYRLPKRRLPVPGHADDADFIATEAPREEPAPVAHDTTDEDEVEPGIMPDTAGGATFATLPDSVPGNGTATAPEGYPIKGNERSGIYHEPGAFAYDRTVATIHFRTAEAAEAAGLRHSKA
jgi:hypothetical protein